MQSVLKIVKGRWKNSRTSWLIRYIYGKGCIIFPTFRILWIFVLLLILKGVYLLYTLCVLELRLSILINDMHYL
jgi:hypothetical protein